MKISVVIPVKDDLRIKDCIDSIDESVEVVISMNRPSQKLRDLVKSLVKSKEKGISYKNLTFTVCEIDYASIAGAYNNGIEHSKYDEILLMDSDCVFIKGCIRRLHNNLKGNLLSKGKVIFDSNSFDTNVVARAREYHTSREVNAYSPPLLFLKSIKKFIGGYYFHPALCWLEDSEFDSRVKENDLHIAYDEEAKVIHPPLTPRRDLRSAFWYGVGKRIGVMYEIHQKPTGIAGSFYKYIIKAGGSEGLLTGLYLFLWKLVLFLGYGYQGIILKCTQ